MTQPALRLTFQVLRGNFTLPTKIIFPRVFLPPHDLSLRPLLVSCLLPVLALSAAGESAAVPSESEERFQREIRPILSRNCLACHGAETRQSGLALESLADILKGGALSGPAVLAGQSGASPLIQYLKGEKQPRMPLTGSPLPEADIAAISQWIDELPAAAAVGAEEPSLSWPWTPLAEPRLPEVRNRSWVKNGVDAFILAKLEEKEMVPAPPASERARLRRIYFGLIGLPPTPEEAERFLGDSSSEAYAREIESLLSRSEYGVRWGRHWLDLVRYADTGGESTDDARSHLWRYRDYVIRAFNQDRPYDRFIKEQIAGDAYRHFGDEAKLGTGFLYQWIPVQRDRGPERRRDVLNDVVGTTGSVFLGMTLGCARCHDHKYDPFPPATTTGWRPSSPRCCSRPRPSPLPSSNWRAGSPRSGKRRLPPGTPSWNPERHWENERRRSSRPA